MALQSISRSVPALLLGTLLASPLPASSQQPGVQPDRWNRAAMEWIALLQAGDFESASARADPAAPTGALIPEALEATWHQLSARVGELVRLRPGLVVTNDGYRVVDLQGEFEREAITLRVVLSEELLISGFSIRPVGRGRAASSWAPSSKGMAGAVCGTGLAGV